MLVCFVRSSPCRRAFHERAARRPTSLPSLTESPQQISPWVSSFQRLSFPLCPAVSVQEEPNNSLSIPARRCKRELSLFLPLPPSLLLLAPSSSFFFFFDFSRVDLPSLPPSLNGKASSPTSSISLKLLVCFLGFSYLLINRFVRATPKRDSSSPFSLSLSLCYPPSSFKHSVNSLSFPSTHSASNPIKRNYLPPYISL